LQKQFADRLDKIQERKMTCAFSNPVANSSIEKAVILAAGRGTRMRSEREGVQLTGEQTEAAASGVKALIPVGRPFLDYVLTALAESGYRDICLVVGLQHDALLARYGQTCDPRLTVSFRTQLQPLGTAHALMAADNFVGSDEFLLINSDNYYPTAALAALRRLPGPGLVGFDAGALSERGNIPPERVNDYALLQSDEQGWLTGIVEKPTPNERPADSNNLLVSMNCWRFGPGIWQACRSIGRSARGEFELPDAVAYSMNQLGQRYQIVVSREPALDLSYQTDIDIVAQKLRGVEVNW
jgi:glucose-1-phosphate thymidylyltransferase